MVIKTTDKKWTIYGINLIPSDSIFQKVEAAIKEGKISQDYLQKITGHRAPIIIDCKRKTIKFERY